MDHIIRKAKLSDGPAVIELWKALIDYHKDIACYDLEMVDEAPEIFSKWYKTHVRSGKRRAIVAEADGQLIGYFMGSIESRANLFKRHVKAHIYDTYIVEEWRGKGVGKALLDDFTAWVQEKGVDQITVFYSPENGPGLGFWHDSGYTDVLIMGHRDL